MRVDLADHAGTWFTTRGLGPGLRLVDWGLGHGLGPVHESWTGAWDASRGRGPG